MKNTHNCRVCGLWIEDPPWGKDNLSPSYEICPCCGVEFGNEDFTIESTKKYRNDWINNGCVWFFPKQKPNYWNLKKQMQSIPNEYK